MTERLYYHDSYLRQFEARVVKSEQTVRGCEVVLDATAFYPTSGGQPHDLGTMSGARIQEVVECGEEVVHCLTGSLTGERLQCEIDWPRRFDHMQQHTGQHVLSQSFVRAAKRNTVGFHMGADYVTIDLDAEGITPQEISEAEHLANEIIYENRPIVVRIVSEAEVPALGLRKESQRTGPLRVVSVEDFDVSACGGTHVGRTGEIGSIIIRKIERVNRQARVEFVCGRRSVVSGQRDLEALSLVARQLSVGLNEVPARVEKQLQEGRQLRKILQSKNRMLASLLAKELYAQVPEHRGRRIVKQLFDEEEMEFLKLLAQALLALGNCVALLGSGGPQVALLFAQNDNLPGDMRQVLPACCRLIEGRGGGTRTLVQAGGKNTGQVQQALDLAEQQLTTGSPTPASQSSIDHP
jgi:alanyl-tRNA synthetase